MSFRLYSPANGLSRNVRSIIQDDLGFLWIGTEDGLFKFDGYRYKPYYHEKGNNNTLSNSIIQKLLSDSKGNIWIATENGGLNCLNPFNDSVKHFLTVPDYKTSLGITHVLCVFEDQTKNIWFGTEGGGLYKITENGFENYRASNNPDSLSNNDVYCIFQDSMGRFWVGTRNGFNLFDYNTKKFKQYLSGTTNLGKKNTGKFVYKIIEAPKSCLWIGTQDDGLYKYNLADGKFFHYKPDTKNFNALQHQAINDLVFDENGLLWIATDGGISVLDTTTQKFITYQADIKNSNCLSTNIVWSICIDKSMMKWFATVGGDGFHRLLPKKEFEHLYHDPRNSNSLSASQIRSIFVDSEGILWISTTTDGLNSYNPKTKTFTRYNDKKFIKSGLSNHYVTTCYEDKAGKLWFGAWRHGIIVYDKSSGTSQHFKPNANDSGALPEANIQFIKSDAEGNIWVGSDGANLSKFIPSTGKFLNFCHNPNDSNSISWGGLQSLSFYDDGTGNIWLGSWGGISVFNKKTYKAKRYNTSNSGLSDNRVISIFGTDTAIWFGTYGGGLNKYSINNQTFTSYYTRHGLPDNTIFAILSDSEGDLWLSTRDGLSKLNIRTSKFENFSLEDGLQDNEFFWGAAYKDKTGKLYFGGINGVTSFYPEKIIANMHVPDVVITEFKIFNKTVFPNEKNSPLKLPISHTKRIDISSSQYVIGFEFVVLDYACPAKNKYAYKMENFDKDWIYTDLREVTYMNLKPGEYVFCVKGANNDGIWNEEGAKISIFIHPPYWETWWFRICILSFIILITFLIFTLRIRVIKRKKEELERLVNQRTIELAREKEQLKNANSEIIIKNAELQQQKEEITAQRDNIEEQNEVLKEKNFEIENQNKIIANKNTSITESINYAAKIQQTILTPDSYLKEYLKDYFVLYLPKDIVSGDFYNVRQIEHYTVIAVVDCTGHGVPGAFMSILGVTLLNEQLRDKSKLTKPNLILDSMRQEVIMALRQTKDANSARDGMDISLCIWDRNENIIYFAAANHLLLIIRQDQILEFKGDKMPIGIHLLHSSNFTSREIKLNPDDKIYLFTDGYADQFNTTLKVKFYLKNLKNLLQKNSNLPMKEQQLHLEKILKEWKGNTPQLDDILIMGILVD